MFWLLAALVVTAPPAWSQGITLEGLNGKQISYTVVYDVSGINPKYGAFSGAHSHLRGELHISGSSVSGQATRVVTYRGRTVGTLSGSLSGAIGKPQEGSRGGNFVWVLQGDSLILLRTFIVGGAKVTITFSGGGCSVRAPMMHEVGAGNTRMASVSGGAVVVTSATQTSSSCSVGG